MLRTAQIAAGMIALGDYHALAAIVLHAQPRRIFEIGTYLGVTSDFFLQIAPAPQWCRSLRRPRLWRFGGKLYNNTLPRESIGSRVAPERRARYRQLIGDSHDVDLLARRQSQAQRASAFIAAIIVRAAGDT